MMSQKMIDLFLNTNDGRWVLHATNCSCKRTRKDRDLDLEGRFNSLQDAQKVWENRNDAGVTEHFCTDQRSK
jgi:hypothetical protein